MKRGSDMPEVITIGETMVSMVPKNNGLLRYENEYKVKIAGAESNVAVGLCKLNHTVGWISRLGNDEMGKYILRQLKSEGVDCQKVVLDRTHRTGLMLKQVEAQNTQVFYYRENSAASHMIPDHLSESYFDNAKILHLTGITPVLSESCRKTIEKAIKIAKKKNILFSFDPNVRKKLWKGKDYSQLLKDLVFQADIVELGIEEAEYVLGTGKKQEILDILLKNNGQVIVAIKDGEKGAYIGNKNGIIQIEPYKCNCVETIGAGDAFNAGFLSGILENKDLETCGKMGAIAGALATEVRGDIEGQPDLEKMQEILSGDSAVYR